MSAPRTDATPRPVGSYAAEADRSYASHEYIAVLAARKLAARGWEPRRGDLVLVSVRVGVRVRGIFVAHARCRHYGDWCIVVAMGAARSFPRETVSIFTPGAETPLTPELARSLRWSFSRPT